MLCSLKIAFSAATVLCTRVLLVPKVLLRYSFLVLGTFWDLNLVTCSKQSVYLPQRKLDCCNNATFICTKPTLRSKHDFYCSNNGNLLATHCKPAFHQTQFLLCYCKIGQKTCFYKANLPVNWESDEQTVKHNKKE